MTTKRCDFELCREIYEVAGLTALHDWLSMTFVDLTDAEDLLAEVPELTVEEALDVTRHLPFTRAVYAVRLPKEFKIETGRDSDTLFCCIEQLDPTDPLAELELEIGLVNYVTTKLISRAAIGVEVSNGKLAVWPIDEEVAGEMVHGAFHMAITILLHLKKLCDSHVVEVRPPPLIGDEKRTHKKPDGWLLNLPRVVLMTSRQAKAYGHRADHGGTHSSPIPHERRGHMKTLRHERYGANRGKQVWWPPTWIGDREWSWNGTTYKVLSRKDDDEE